VGVDKRGRLGRFSKRVTVPLALAPPTPSQPTITYNESKITVRWSPPASASTADTWLLPSRPLGSPPVALAYHVYDSETGVRLTSTPVKDLAFEDSRIEWGATRCYAVRAVEAIGNSTLESEAGEPRCEKLVDTFPPAAPKGLNAVSSEGAINLIWEANAEPDLAGYYVLRGQAGGHLDRITPMPLAEASFLDSNVPRGLRFVYAVVAIDKAGNVSAQSERVEETAR
jgi:fibronectin type 3 domain-containing protein